MGKSAKSAAVACAFACATLAGSAAHAEPAQRIGIDWGKALVELDSYARHGSIEQQAPTANAEHTERSNQLYVQNAGNAWFGVAPSVALVARDWGEAFRLAGDRLSLVDAMRLSSSTRMVMTRVRLSDTHTTRVTPFAQLGLGQWRIDRNLMPRTPLYTEVATQIGGGLEIQVTNKWQIACEAAQTLFLRAERDTDNLPAAPHMWSTTLASRLTW